jgi:hypothetical protein
MNELTLNLHMHTKYSDGTGSHFDIARAAMAAGVDAVIVTDHNIHVQGYEGYFHENDRKVLLLVGEEIHDQAREPQKNHLLVFNAEQELATYASDPQSLLDKVKESGGLSFIAHPYDPELKMFGEDDISWVNWEVTGFTGIELWNGFSELKNVIKSKLQAIFFAFAPQFVANGPLSSALEKWDELLLAGRKVVAIGGADAHALKLRMGPLKRTVFPYEYHFSAVNTHLLLQENLTDDLNTDKQKIFAALKAGHAFIGYDLAYPTNGFRFSAKADNQDAIMGEDLLFSRGITFQLHVPGHAETSLLKNGKVIKQWQDQQFCTYLANEPGIYRVECHINFLGKKRGWIFSNPIYANKEQI